jgi:hypothetical protein
MNILYYFKRIAATYLLVVIIWHLFIPDTYTYRSYNFINHNVLTSLMKPVMGIFGYRKVTHWYDWEGISSDKVLNTEPLIIENDTNIRHFEARYALVNAWASLGGVQTTAIIKPKDYTGTWSLIYCQNNQCKANTLSYEGEVKILVDGQMELYALTERGEVRDVGLVKKFIEVK